MTAYTEEFIHRKLDASQDAVEAALLAIYERSCAENTARKLTGIRHSVYFEPQDREFCIRLVDSLKSGRRLSADELRIARRKMKMHWRHLVRCMTTQTLTAAADEIPMQEKSPVYHVFEEAVNAEGSW